MANRNGKIGNSDRFYFLRLQNHWRLWLLEIKTLLLLGEKAMTNLDSILESRDITLPTKVHIVKAMIFPGVMYRCELNHKEGWAPKIDAFKLWCWRRLLRVLWTARRSNLSILKEINSAYSQEGLKLNLKLQYFWPPDAKSQLTGRDSGAGKDWKQK